MTQKFRKGDIVTIRATIVSGEPTASMPASLYVEPHGHHTNIFVDAKHVEMVTPFFKIGERVRKKLHPEITGTVVATLDNDCWVDLDLGRRGTIKATELEPDPKGELHVVAA